MPNSKSELWVWGDNLGSLIVINVPLLWVMLIVRDVDSGLYGEWRMLRIGEAVHVCRLGKIWEI